MVTNDKPWEYAGLPTRQTALYREAIIDGASYAVVLPGAPQPRILLLPSSLIALDWGGDPTAEWPVAAALLRDDGAPWLYLTGTEATDTASEEVTVSHSAGVCPVVRFAPYADLSGRCASLIDRLRPAARRYVKTVNDRLSIQHSNSWRVRATRPSGNSRRRSSPTATSSPAVMVSSSVPFRRRPCRPSSTRSGGT